MSTMGYSVDDSDDYLDIFYDAAETQSQCDFENSFRASDDLPSDENSSSDDIEIFESAIDTPSKATQLNGIDNGTLETPSDDELNKHSSNPKKKILKYRKKLPQSMHSRNFSIWNILKQAVGKDLSRIAMPVIFNEPLSFLQRISEYMDYVGIMHEAVRCEDPLDRLLHVAVFMISCNASTESRVGKPFNPLLGETYELIREDLDFKLVAEQVSHHPPISALYAESKSGFQLTMNMEPELKFWGKDIEVRPKGGVTIKIPKYGDIYTFEYISSGVHNIIVGQLWIELYGTCIIKNHTTGDVATINFKPAGWFAKEINQVEGYICNNNNEKVRLLKSDWTKYTCSCKVEDAAALNNLSKTVEGEVDLDNLPPSVELHWKVRPKPSYSPDMYMMTEFSMGLNELLDVHKETVAQTDCRFRPDLRCLENGDMDGAATEKFRLEEKQRATRRRMEAAKEVWKPRWFSYEPSEYSPSKKDWVFNDNYFERDFSNSPDIY